MAAALVVVPGVALAEEPPPSAPSESSTASTAAEVVVQPKVVRIALSKKAADKLSEQRVRRLVELQVGEGVSVPAEGAGPLDETAVRVFIDMPEPALVVVQVQAPDGRLESRSVDVGGLPWEVATRFVSIAASQSVRALLAPRRKPRLPVETPADRARALAARPSVDVGGSLELAYASALATGLFGSRLELSFHQAPLSEHLSVAALGTFGAGGWFETGVLADHRFWVGPDLRLDAGLGFALAITKDVRDEDDAEDVEVWVRPHARFQLDVRALPHAWLGLRFEPGITVDPKLNEAGLWLGGGLRLSYEGP